MVTLGIPIALFLVDQYYLPMDLLIERALDRTGLGALIEQLRSALN